LQELAAQHGLANVADQAEHQKEVFALADEARNEWESYRRGLGSYARMFKDVALDDKMDAALKAAVPALVGYTTLGIASVGVGLLVGALSIGSKSFRKLLQRRKNDPYRYLTKLTSHGATIIADPAAGT
jgi:hypothetical protein